MTVIEWYNGCVFGAWRRRRLCVPRPACKFLVCLCRFGSACNTSTRWRPHTHAWHEHVQCFAEPHCAQCDTITIVSGIKYCNLVPRVQFRLAHYLLTRNAHTRARTRTHTRTCERLETICSELYAFSVAFNTVHPFFFAFCCVCWLVGRTSLVVTHAHTSTTTVQGGGVHTRQTLVSAHPIESPCSGGVDELVVLANRTNERRAHPRTMAFFFLVRAQIHFISSFP